MADQLIEEALGPCGCVDYHMADCPTRTAARAYYYHDPYDDYYDD